MNIRQLDAIIQVLLTKFKQSPGRWSESVLSSFCEMTGLYWAEKILTPTQQKLRSQNISVDKRGSQRIKKLQPIPLLEICVRSYEEIFEICNEFGQLISTSVDINLYFQIQKLKIWSFIVLQYQNFRDNLRKHYSSSLFSQAKCRSCSAEVHCACELLQKILTQIEIYLKSIYADKPTHGHISYLEMSLMDPIIEQRQSRIRERSVYITQDLINILLKSAVHLQQLSPIYWDLEDIRVFLGILKFEDYYPLLHQNQIDGFVLLMLVNPPFKDECLFLKCLLINQENKSKGNLFNKRLSMTSQNMTAANRYYQLNSFCKLLHYLLTMLNFTIYKSDYPQYFNQRKANRINYLSLYYFLEPKKKPRIQSAKKSMQIMHFPIEARKQSKSFGDLDRKQLEMVVAMVDKSKQQRETVTLDEFELKEVSNEVSNEDSNYIVSSLTCQESEQFTMVNDQERVSIMQESRLLIDEQPIQADEYLQQSVLLQQSQLLQNSIIFEQQSDPLQQSQVIHLEQSILMDDILQEDLKLTKQQTNPIRDQLCHRIQKLTLPIHFDPFQVLQQTHLKLKCDLTSKYKTVTILGASIGRSQENTFAFMDHTKISSYHAKIIYNDKFCLIDIGSKGGTFFKVKHNHILEKGMSIYIGNKFAFKLIDIIQQPDQQLLLTVKYEYDGTAKHKYIQLKKGDKYSIGKDVNLNNFTFLHSQCNRLLSTKHLEISYDLHYKLGQIKLMMNDLDSRNGTWVRLSEKQIQSNPIPLSKGVVFNLSFELVFEVTDLVIEI